MFKYHTLKKVTQLHIWLVLIGVAWSGVLLGLCLWSVDAEQKHLSEMIRLKGESLAHHTQALRSWVGGCGGIYVQVSEKIYPNPLLEMIPERDIDTPSGRKLTLLNSPAVLRQISDEFERESGDRIRLTAHKPMSPLNIPDEWEQQALDVLERGGQQVSGFVTNEGKSALRLMWPMKVQPGCVRCHRSLAEKPQKILGGLSILVDKKPYDQLYNEVVRQFSTAYFFIWVIGLLGIITFDVWGANLLRRIEFASTHDALTQLRNRREIENVLVQEIGRAQRYGNPLSVMMLDIDHFKQVNDCHGHQAGDEALRVVARVVNQTVRNTDFVGRYGGEKMLVIAPETCIDNSKTLAQRLRDAVAKVPVALGDEKKLELTVSIGVAAISAPQETMQTLLKRADDALYRAKEAGRNRVCFAESPEDNPGLKNPS